MSNLCGGDVAYAVQQCGMYEWLHGKKNRMNMLRFAVM